MVSLLFHFNSDFIKREMFKRFVLILLLARTAQAQPTFLLQQLKYPKVAAAKKEKGGIVHDKLIRSGIDSAGFSALIRIFKAEKTLELWLKNKGKEEYFKYETFPICANSGNLGPKRREGDLQVPEGLYIVNFFNAFSDYYLGMQINYPNASDMVLGKKPYGGQILIHGNCVTIGCIPITDALIKELYLVCLYSKGQGHDVRVQIFPFRMDADKLEKAGKICTVETLDFWKNLKPFYDCFNEKKIFPNYIIDKSGRYEILGKK